MKKYNVPVMTVSVFDAENVVTTSTKYEDSNAKSWAEYRLNQNSVATENIITFTF